MGFATLCSRKTYHGEIDFTRSILKINCVFVFVVFCFLGAESLLSVKKGGKAVQVRTRPDAKIWIFSGETVKRFADSLNSFYK